MVFQRWSVCLDMHGMRWEGNLSTVPFDDLSHLDEHVLLHLMEMDPGCGFGECVDKKVK